MKKFASLGLLIAGNLLASCASLDSPVTGKTVAEGPVYSAKVAVSGVAAPPRQLKSIRPTIAWSTLLPDSN